MSNEVVDTAMARYADGDDRAFEVLYDQLSPRLFAFLRHQSTDASRCEDILQQTFLKIHRNRGTFRPGSPVVPWAFAIARRLAIDAGRRSRFEVSGAEQLLAESPSSEPHLDSLISAKQLDGQLTKELARLPESQRTAFRLIRQDGLSTAEAAEVLGVTVSAVKLRAHRAYQVLRKAFGEIFEPPEEE